MAIFNREQRPLKRPRIGPPDCYPQMTKQKEDDLSSDTLKNGFKNVELVEDEIGSAKPFVTVCNFSRLGSHFKAITEEKQRLNNVYDVNKKKNQVNLKDVYWPVTAKNRTNLNAWLQDLAINKSLKDLSKKIPTLNSNRKEEVFQLLSDNSVPLARSAWFIKLLSTGYNTSSDSKKKRPGGDLSHDWTQSLTKYLKDLLSKLSDHSHGQGKVTLSSDILSAYKQFLYNSQLADWLYQEGLLQRHSFLQWLIDTLDKVDFADSVSLTLLVPLTFKYIRDITASQSLARVLAGICTRYISYLYYHNNNNANEKESKPSSTNSTDNGTTEDWSLLAIYNDCQRHYPRLLLLTCILQIIAIFCPGALVYSIGAWNKGSSNDSLMHHGSPLDYLPGSICQLPGIELLEARVQKQMLAAMKASQSQIQLRSTLVENRWSSEKCKESDISVVVTQVLSVLEIHDKGAYARHNNGISVENLYTNIFPAIVKGSLVKDVLNNDEAIIMHLLEWAVTPFRYGFHRPILVAILLERRQGDLERMNENDAICNHLYYQELLLRFLDYYAILPSDDSELELEQSNASFKLLVALFAELIRRKVFSHDKYIMTLISRGDISTTSNSSRSYANSPDQIVGENDHDGESDECSHLGKKNEEENVIECGSPFSVRRDSEADISDQLKQQLSQQQEELQQLLESNETNSCNGNMDIMEYDNATDDVAFAKPEQENIANKTEGNLSDNDERGRDDDKDKNFNNVTTDTRKTFQHIAYVLHFPLPDIDLRNVDVGSHESRQRFTVLYGVGESRNLALQEVTEMWDEINICVDYLTTCDSQNSSSNDSNRINYASYLAPTIRKFKTLHIYSQYVLANTCANLIMENVIKENRYPSINKFNFVADLMEIAGDINGLLQFVIRLLSEGDSGAAEIRSSLVLTIVAVFRRYYNCLLVSLKQATEAVEGLWRIVKHITNPASCSSADRCALACLADIFTHCSDLKLKNRAELESVLQKVKDSLPCSGLSKSNDPIDWKIFGEEFKEPREANPNQICQAIRYDVMKKYNFVCNAILHVYHCGTYVRLLDIATLCAEVTSYSSGLNGEWMGVLRALCCSPSSNFGFTELLTQLEISDSRSADNIAMFTAVLISRHCFSLEELLRLVILPPLHDTRTSRSINQHFKIGAGARLSCHLLLRLLEKPSHEVNSYVDYNSGELVLKSWDRSLLSTWHHTLDLNYIYIVLKTMAAMVDSNKDNNSKDIFNFTTNMGILDEPDTTCANLALNVLKSICAQPLIQQHVLCNLRDCCSKEFLLDSMLTKRQAIYLQYLLCCADSITFDPSDIDTDINKEDVLNLLKDINQWSLRTTWLEIELHIKLCTRNEERTRIIDNLAEAIIKVYQTSNITKCASRSDMSAILSQEGNISLIAPFVAKLSNFAQGHILKAAGEVLERSKWWLPDDDNPCTLNQKPFLSLILTCLRCQDEHKRCFLSSIQKQFQQFLRSPIEERMPDNLKQREFLNDAIHLRLSLIGAVFDTILRDLTLCKDWIRLMLQFIASGTIDLFSEDKQLLSSILDMLSVLISTLNVSESVPSMSDEARKVNASLVKKFRKELDGINSPVVRECKKLFSLETPPVNVISVSSETDDTCYQNELFKTVAVDHSVHVNNWDILESTKFSSPTLWSYFAGVKVDRKPLTYENQFFSTMQHSHMIEESPVFYLPTKELEINPLPSAKPTTSKTVKNRTSNAKTAVPKEITPPSSVIKPEVKATKAAPGKRQRRRSTIKEKEEKRTTPSTITVTNTISKTTAADSMRDRQYLAIGSSSGTARSNATQNNEGFQSLISKQVKVSQPVSSYTISDRSQSETRAPRKNSGTQLRDLLGDMPTAMVYPEAPNVGRSQMQTTMVTSASDYSSFQSMNNNTIANINQGIDSSFSDTLNIASHSDNLSQRSLQQGMTSSLMDNNSMVDNQISTNFMSTRMPVNRSAGRMSQNLINSNSQQSRSNDVLRRLNKFNGHQSHYR